MKIDINNVDKDCFISIIHKYIDLLFYYFLHKIDINIPKSRFYLT